MADTVQIETIGADVFPFKQTAPLAMESGKASAVPWGQAIFNSAFESPAIGVGDTGTLVMDLNLPKNYCCMLRSLHVSAYDSSAINWIFGVVGLAYQLPGGPYKNSMTSLPESDYLWWRFGPGPSMHVRNRTSVHKYQKSWTIDELSAAGVGRSAGSLDNPMNVPVWVSPDYPGSSVTIYIENDVASSAANDFRLNAVFDLYTQDQAFAAEVMSSPRRLAS